VFIMARNYALRPNNYPELNSDDFFNQESDAASTVGAVSSPPGPPLPDIILPDVPFVDLQSDDFPDEESNPNYMSRAPKNSNTQKTRKILDFMEGLPGKFSLHDFLTELFTSDDSVIEGWRNTYFGVSGHVHLLDVAIGDKATRDPDIVQWIIAKAADICSQETSFLTDNASRGPHYHEALYLRAPARSVDIQRLHSVSIPHLLQIYERTIPLLQNILQAVIGKEVSLPEKKSSRARSQRNPDMVCILKLLYIDIF
jgi:hypothetical protein